MNREDRAKQFAPFDALKGLREALRQKEIEHERQAKREPSEEDAQILQDCLIQVKKGDTIELEYFCAGYYLSIKGVIESIDTIYKILQIAGKKIFYDDISQIKKL